MPKPSRVSTGWLACGSATVPDGADDPNTSPWICTQIVLQIVTAPTNSRSGQKFECKTSSALKSYTCTTESLFQRYCISANLDRQLNAPDWVGFALLFAGLLSSHKGRAILDGSRGFDQDDPIPEEIVHKQASFIRRHSHELILAAHL